MPEEFFQYSNAFDMFDVHVHSMPPCRDFPPADPVSRMFTCTNTLATASLSVKVFR
jgi:hypothetical protein